MNRTTLVSALMAATVSFGGSAALAQMGPMADPYGDGVIVRADADARAAQRFDMLDANKDGFLSAEEMAAPRPAGGPPAGAGAPGGPPPPEGRRGGGPGGGPGGGMRGGMMMRMADANGDGKISKEEFLAAEGKRFDQMDENHDGKVTKEERTNFFEDMRARMMMMGGGRDGGQ